MTYKTIAELIPTIQASELVGYNVDGKKRKKKKRGLITQGVGNVVGVSVIQSTSDLIAGL